MGAFLLVDREMVQMDGGSYDVWVTPEGGSTIKLADDYLFRSTAADMNDLGRVVMWTAETWWN